MPNSATRFSRNILVIDDDQAVTLTLEPYFAQQNYNLIVAKTAEEGLNEALAKLPSIIFVTIGPAVIELIRQLGPVSGGK